VRAGQLHLMDSDGSHVIRLSELGGRRQPTWSPDGRHVAYASECEGQGCILVSPTDTPNATPSRIGFERGFLDGPAWSPDGRRIAFTSDWRAFDFVYDLYVANVDDASVDILAAGPFFAQEGLLYYFQPAWSPDGRRMAAVRCAWAFDNCYPASDIVVMNADGSDVRVIAESAGFARPSWSPDGTRIVVSASTCRTCASDIHVMRADGSERRLLVANGHSPAWRW
jgi:Tol biopolymer transport system component